MSSAAGRSVAALLGEIDTMESELKGERLQIWHATRAERGLPAPGPAPFGWRLNPTGAVSPRGLPVRELVPVPDEAVQLRDLYRRLHAGESLLSLARDASTSPTILTRWLTNPTQAGLRVHGGVEYPLLTGSGKPVKPIIPVEMWRATVAHFDGRRSSPRDPQRHTHLLTGLAVCERCDRTVRSGGHDVSGNAIYRCMPNVGDDAGIGRGCGRAWRMEIVDRFADGVVRERLRREGGAGLMAPVAVTADAAELLDEASGIRARLSGLATDAVLRGVDVSAAVSAGKARLAEIERLTGAAGTVNPVVATLATAKRPERLYASFTDVGRQQAVIRTALSVTLLAPPRGRWPTFGGDQDKQAAWYIAQCVRIGPPSP
jgi:hypothetical protein